MTKPRKTVNSGKGRKARAARRKARKAHEYDSYFFNHMFDRGVMRSRPSSAKTRAKIRKEWNSATKPPKRTKQPNPGAPSLPPNRMIPVRAVKVNNKGVVTQVVIEDRHLSKLKKGKRK